MLIVTETGSRYEFDLKQKRARRLSGELAPTERTGTDGVWKSYQEAGQLPNGRILIVWEGEKCTVTSRVAARLEGLC